MLRIPAATILGLALACATGLAMAVPDLETDTTESNAGFYRLNWHSDSAGTAEFELQESTDAAFTRARAIYRGPDLATVISGRRDGVYHYRIRATGNPDEAWSPPVTVTVKHHHLSRAFTIFAMGGVVFIATLWLIVSGARRGDEDDRA